MRGFSLVEILVVMLVASLMMLLVPPLFSGSLSRLSMNSAADQVSVSLKRTKNQAIARGEPVPWIMDIENKSYQIGLSGKPRQLDKDIEIVLTTAQAEVQGQGEKAAIRFYPDGGATGGKITLQMNNYLKTINIDWLTGRIDVR